MKKPFAFIVDKPLSRLDTFLHVKSGESRTFVQEQIRAGLVQLNGKTVYKPSHPLRLHDRVEGLFEEQREITLEPIAYPLDILYEDAELLILNKPQDMVIHPASGYKAPTLVHYLLHYFRSLPEFKELREGRPGIVHRLDRGTSGALIVAKNRRSQDVLSELFKKRSIVKEYEAIVWGKAPLSGHIESSIGRDRKDRKKMSSHCEVGRTAMTDFSLISHTKNFSHVALFPKTGRTHQLRVHLSEHRLPIVGDLLYGPKSLKPRMERLNPILRAALIDVQFTFLHAKRLTFRHPFTGTDLSIEAKRPEVFDKLLSLMKNFDS